MIFITSQLHIKFSILLGLHFASNLFAHAFVIKSSHHLPYTKQQCDNIHVNNVKFPLSMKKCNYEENGWFTKNINTIDPLIRDWKKMTRNIFSIGLVSAALTTNIEASVAGDTNQSTNQIPKTALVIETSQKPSTDDSILKAQIDGKALVKSIIKNRKDLGASFKRIVDFTSSEVQTSPWIEVGRELIDIEGDVVPGVNVQVPQDWQGALKELTMGKFDVAVNGEILYIDIQEAKGEKPGDDEITIRIKGTRASLPELQSQSAIMAAEKIDPGSDFWNFWNSPLPVDENIVPSGVTNGQAILVTTTTGILGSYAISYQYYQNEIAQEQKADKEKKERLAKKKQLKEKKKSEALQTNISAPESIPSEDPSSESAQVDKSDKKVEDSISSANVDEKSNTKVDESESISSSQDIKDEPPTKVEQKQFPSSTTAVSQPEEKKSRKSRFGLFRRKKQ
jgi:hypothetical protein